MSCTDAKDDGNLKFIKEVETVVTQLWKLSEKLTKATCLLSESPTATEKSEAK